MAQDSEGAVQVYVAHRPALVNYATRIMGERNSAEDIVQEAYFRFRKAAQSQQLDDPVHFLYRIVRNLALDLQRRLTVERRHALETLADDRRRQDQQVSVEEDVIAREQLGKLMQAMEALPERTRIALEMYRFGDCTLKQIADHLGLSVSYTHKLVKDAIKHCQQGI